jgi:hypothetical protein
MSTGLIILLSIIASLLLGGVIVGVVETARRTGIARSGRLGRSVGVAPAASLRATLRQEVGATRAAVDRADGLGLPVGQLREVIASITTQAARLDDQLAVADRSPVLVSSSALAAQLRDNHGRLVTITERIRADLAEAEVRRSSVELGEALSRAELELELLRGVDGQLESRIAEIDAEYRRQITDRREQPEG